MTRVVVVGAGNAALCAALSARGAGAEVLVLEAATEGEFGGNSAYTAGAMRVAYTDGSQLSPLVDGTPQSELDRCDFEPYTQGDFERDVVRMSADRADPVLAATLCRRSLSTLSWMAGLGVGFEPAYGTQAFEDEGRWRFWGGLPVRVHGEGHGLIAALRAACARAGVEIRSGVRVTALERDAKGIVGVRAGETKVTADGVVLACGGFEASADARARHLGEAYRAAKVRGTRHNTGDGIFMAIEAGAATAGDWSGCHAVAWDDGAPDFGTLEVAHEFTRNSYQFGIVVNADGLRFLDEGADFRNYTYAAYGRELLAQPGGVAWQVFDAAAEPYLRREYFRDDASVAVAASLEALADATEGLNSAEFLATVRAYNEAAGRGAEALSRRGGGFDPAVKDGLAADLPVPKSNWARPLQVAPFRAYRVCCGVTFTFGGLAVDGLARVLDERRAPIPGLHAAGELVGGLWWGNYPGGAGLTAGAVFGRLAGLGAAGAEPLD